jgi:hypothetical protein
VSKSFTLFTTTRDVGIDGAAPTTGQAAPFVACAGIDGAAARGPESVVLVAGGAALMVCTRIGSLAIGVRAFTAVRLGSDVTLALRRGGVVARTAVERVAALGIRRGCAVADIGGLVDHIRDADPRPGWRRLVPFRRSVELGEARP